MEPMAVGYHAVRRGQPRPEDRVLVIGGGPIGQACLLAARRLGVKALALSDVSPSRRDLCAVLEPRSSTHRPAICRRRSRTGSAARRPWSSTRSVSARQLPTHGGLRSWEQDRLGRNGFAATRAFCVRVEHRGASISDPSPTRCGVRRHGGVGRHRYRRDRSADRRSSRLGGAPQSFDHLARGRSAASKILVFPQGPPESRRHDGARRSPTSVPSLWVRAAGPTTTTSRASTGSTTTSPPRWRVTPGTGRAVQFGLNVLGTLVVEVEADDGTVGFAVTTAGEPGA